MSTQIFTKSLMGGKYDNPEAVDITSAPFAVYDNGSGNYAVQPSGVLNITGVSSGDVILTAKQASAQVLQVAGTASGGANHLYVPNSTWGQQWTVFNNIGGNLLVQGYTGSTGTGSAITIATGKRAIVYWDGTNVVRVTADT